MVMMTKEQALAKGYSVIAKEVLSEFCLEFNPGNLLRTDNMLIPSGAKQLGVDVSDEQLATPGMTRRIGIELARISKENNFDCFFKLDLPKAIENGATLTDGYVHIRYVRGYNVQTNSFVNRFDMIGAHIGPSVRVEEAK